MATKQPVNVDLRAAQSERDLYSRKLARLEKENKTNTSEYAQAKRDFEAADKRFKELETSVQTRVSAAQQKKTKTREQKEKVNLTADLNDARRRGDETKVQEISKKLQELDRTIPPGVFTPTDSNKVKPAGVVTAEEEAKKPAAKTTSISSELKKAAKTAKETADQVAKRTLTIDEVYNLATQEFGAIDLIFKQDKELQKILTQAVNEGWTQQKFANSVQNTTWFKSKAPELQRREFNKRQYRDLLQQPNADKQALYRNTEYGRGLAQTIQMVKDNAIATGAAIDDATAEIIAQDLYDSANETDPYSVRNQIRARITYKPGALMGGEAGNDLRELQNTARANGLDLDRQFGNSVQGWLQRLNQGESIETFKQLIRNTAKVGLPDKVGALIDQGVDLDTIYSPYKNMMAATLEVSPETIQLNDPTLRMAIGPDKEMSLYDYQRSLRKDPRWQYTNNARADVSKAALQVLKDFGFQG